MSPSGHIILGRAEHDDRPVPGILTAQGLDEIQAVHNRHIPVQQDGVGHVLPALLKRFRAVAGFNTREFQLFQNAPGDFPDNARIVNDETGLHTLALP